MYKYTPNAHVLHELSRGLQRGSKTITAPASTTLCNIYLGGLRTTEVSNTLHLLRKYVFYSKTKLEVVPVGCCVFPVTMFNCEEVD